MAIRPWKGLRWRLIWIAGLVSACVFLLVPREVSQRAYDPETGGMRETTVRRVPITLGLDLKGGIHLALEPDASRGAVTDCSEAIRRAEQVVRTRIDEFGTLEPVVQIVGDCRLVVELPGVTDPDRARAIVQRTAFLEFRLTDSDQRFRRALPALEGLDELLVPGGIPGEFLVPEARVAEVEGLLATEEVQRRIPRGVELAWGSPVASASGQSARSLYALESRPILTGEELEEAIAVRDPTTGSPEVRFEVSRAGGRRFAEATGRNVGNHLAILLDGRVQGRPPEIAERIVSSGRIEMHDRSYREASDLALTLRSGALPVPLEVVEQRTIGPSLGQDSIRAGIRASGLAVAVVVLVVAAYYGFFGLVAVGGLLMYVLYTLGGLAFLGFALSLPGLAGFALSVGMAVDANVLIFERIREELREGTPLRPAVDRGFRHAMSAIVDSNVTTAITALILHFIGTGAVKGFAITLLIGLVASMISAIFVTRTFFLWWLRKPRTTPRLDGISIPFLTRANHDFVRLRRWAGAAALAFVVPGLILLAAHGVGYGIEFTGGTMTHVRTAQPVEAAVLRSALADGGLPGAEIQRFGSDREYVVRARVGESEGMDARERESAADGERAPDGSTSGVDAVAGAVRSALDAALDGGYEIVRAEAVGPSVGNELQRKALLGVLCSFGTTLAYLAIRFEWRFGFAAVVTTVHDIAATLAFIRYLDLEMSLVVVAAILTVIGYSLNDTIVIFDRVRENLSKTSGSTLSELLNRSINETLPRTVLTGGTTLAAALVLSFLAGEVIEPFGLVMTFGVVVGTFSSIFVAAPVLLWIERRWGEGDTP